MESLSVMNEYGRLAMNHWKRHFPSDYQRIEDPESHFTTMGEQAQEQQTQLEDEIIARTPASPDYLTEVARRNQARATAKELVLTDLLPTPQEPEQDAASDPRSEWVDPSGMPTDPSHPLWADLEDETITPAQFQARRKEWIDSLPMR